MLLVEVLEEAQELLILGAAAAADIVEVRDLQQHPYTGAGGGSKNNGSNQTNTLHDNN